MIATLLADADYTAGIHCGSFAMGFAVCVLFFVLYFAGRSDGKEELEKKSEEKK